MKKYLITGALTLSLGGFLTSCHDSEIDYSSIAEAKQATFAENFVKFYGEIDPEQDWGFGTESSSTRTRGCNSDANNWDYSKYDNIPEVLTGAQKDKVRRWFQQNRNPEGVSVNFSDFFVQQVYKGGTNVTSDSKTTEHYTDGDGKDIIGGNQMDWLCAGYIESQNGYDHIENFNGANYSNGAASKEIWDGKTYEAGYPLDAVTGAGQDWAAENKNHRVLHNDMIALMENSNTNSFGYHSSQGSVYYHNKFVIIPGDEIQKWDNSTTATFDGETQNSDVSKMWFVGFDYEGDTRENPYFDPNQESKFLIKENSANDPNAEEINNRGGLKAVIGGRDYYFSDWIVRITPGHKRDIPQTTTGGSTEYNESTTGTYLRRYVQNHKWVFCEDLGQASNRKDFDYNDLVFDAKIVQDYIVTITDGIEVSVVSNGDPYALITPLAAGGELTITVAGQNVHQMFGQGDATIINTIDADKESDVRSSGVSYAPQSAGRIDCQQTATYATSNILDIPINVRIYNEAFTTLARKGEAPHKIAVTPGTRWAQERVDINDAQPGFAEWVRNVSYGTSFWSDEASENRYPYMPSDQYLTNDMTRQYLPDELISGQTTKTYSITPSSTETLVWSDLTGATTFGTEWDNTTKWIGYSTLAQNDPNGKAFGVGSVIRAYVIAENNFNIQFFSVTNDNQWTKLIEATSGNYDSHLSNGSGYIEYTVTQEALAAMQTNSFVVLGINFKLLGVTVDNTNARSSSTPEAATYTAPTLASGETSVYSSNSGVDLNATGETVNTGLTTVGENTEITVHGVGENANISVTTSDGTALETASSARTRAAAQTSFKFKVQSEAVAAKIRTSGIKVKLNSGSFKMYMVAAKISAYTPSASSTEDSEGTSLLASGPLNGTETIDKGKFSGVKINDEIRIYYTSLGQWYWQVITWEGLNKGYNYTINGWGATSINTNNNFKNETEKYIYIPIDNVGFVEMLTNRGIRIQCDQIVVDRIVLVKK